MRHTIGLSLCLTAIIVLAGCHEFLTSRQTAVTVIVEGNGKFPDALAGRWKADRDGWEFVIDTDGRITSAVHSLGRIRIAPGRKATLPTRGGGEGVFEPGPWTVHYQRNTSQLTLRIAMDHIRIDMAGTILEGKSTDTFAGTIAPADGVWQTQWTTFNNYTARTPDGQTKDLSTNQTYGETKALTFQKVAPP